MAKSLFIKTKVLTQVNFILFLCIFKSFTFIYEIYLFPSQKFTFTLHSLVSRPNISSWQLRTELNFTSFVSFQKFQIYLFLSRARSFCFVNFNISVSAIRRDLLCYSAFLSPSLPFQNCTNPTKSIMSQPNKVLSQNFWRQVGQIWENHTHILYLKQERWCSSIKRHKIFCDEINFSLDRNESCHPWLSGWPCQKKWQDRWSKSESTWLPPTAPLFHQRTCDGSLDVRGLGREELHNSNSHFLHSFLS